MGLLSNNIIILIAFLFTGMISFANFSSSNCDVNILDRANLNEETRQHFNLPFDQYSSNICYSYTAADILSFRLQRSISPLFLAQTLARENDSTFDASSNGEIVNALAVANEGVGLCTNEGYSSRVPNDAAIFNPRPLICSSRNQIVRITDPFKIFLYRDCLSGYTPRHTLDDAFKNRVLSEINTELNLGRIVGVSVNLNQIKFEKPGHARSSEMAAHAMSIIGRKWVNNRCEYVFRNSYGTDGCGNGILDSSRVNCSSPSGFPSGTISISEQVFKEAMHRVVIIKNHISSGNSQDDFEAITPSFCQQVTSASPTNGQSTKSSAEDDNKNLNTNNIETNTDADTDADAADDEAF